MPEDDYVRFLMSQQDVYKINFSENNPLRTVGTSHHGLNGQTGYLVAFRYDSAFTQSVEGFSSELARYAPFLAYSSRDIHTTLADYEFGKDFSFDQNKINSLMASVEDCLPTIRKPKINYETWLANQKSVLLTGIPDPAFLQSARAFNEAAKNRGITTRLPWGAHITAGRFIGERPASDLGTFFTALSATWTAVEVQPVSIDVGCHTFQDDKFNFNVVRSFALR